MSASGDVNALQQKLPRVFPGISSLTVLENKPYEENDDDEEDEPGSSKKKSILRLRRSSAISSVQSRSSQGGLMVNRASVNFDERNSLKSTLEGQEAQAAKVTNQITHSAIGVCSADGGPNLYFDSDLVLDDTDVRLDQICGEIEMMLARTTHAALDNVVFYNRDAPIDIFSYSNFVNVERRSEMKRPSEFNHCAADAIQEGEAPAAAFDIQIEKRQFSVRKPQFCANFGF